MVIGEEPGVKVDCIRGVDRGEVPGEKKGLESVEIVDGLSPRLGLRSWLSTGVE